MTDVQWLFAVLALLYSWECACWVRRGTVGFRTWLGRRWRTLHPGTLLGNQRGGFIFAPPLPPLGTLLTGSQLPVSFSPEGVLAFVAPSVNPGGRPVQSGQWVRFEAIRNVEPSGKQVLINGQSFLKTASPGWALYLSNQLRELSQLAPGKRTAAIESLVKRNLDPKVIERRWQEFQARTAPLRWLPNLLFGYLFVVAPLLIWRFGIERCWLGLLVGLLSFTVTTAILFRRAHKHFYPEATEERFTHFLTLLLAPATTIRAYDILSRPLLETFHPLAIACAFCRDNQFREVARLVWRELRYPGLPLCPNEEPAAQAAEHHGRLVLQQAIEQLLRKSGLDPESLLPAPVPTDDSCQAYCPRCQAQFTTRERVCADCGGLALVPFK